MLNRMERVALPMFFNIGRMNIVFHYYFLDTVLLLFMLNSWNKYYLFVVYVSYVTGYLCMVYNSSACMLSCVIVSFKMTKQNYFPHFISFYLYLSFQSGTFIAKTMWIYLSANEQFLQIESDPTFISEIGPCLSCAACSFCGSRPLRFLKVLRGSVIHVLINA